MKRTAPIFAAFAAIAMVTFMTFGYTSRPYSSSKNCIFVYPGDTLQDAYDYITDSDRDAQMGTLGVLNQRTMFITAGVHVSTALVLDTNYVNIVGLGDATISDISGVAIVAASKTCRIDNIRIDASSIANCISGETTVHMSNVRMTDGTNIIPVSTELCVAGAVAYGVSGGAVPVTHTVVSYTSVAGAEDLVLPDGVIGQVLTINHIGDGGNGVVTPSSQPSTWTSIDLADIGDFVTLKFMSVGGWVVTGVGGTSTPPVITL